MLYRCEVTEVRHYIVTYLVEADSPAEARRLAGNGETVRELDEYFECVYEREVKSVEPNEVRLRD